MPLNENNSDSDTSSIVSNQKPLAKSPSSRYRSSDRKQMARSSEQKISVDTKENVDLALEINITTGPNVQVKLYVHFPAVYFSYPLSFLGLTMSFMNHSFSTFHMQSMYQSLNCHSFNHVASST